MGFGIGYGAEEYAKSSGAVLVIKSEVANKSVDFPAFLTDFSQTFASEWATEQVYGRNDPIATFQGTKRTISLAWDIPSATLADAKKNLEKCGDLASFLYPGYMSTAPLPKKKGKNGSKGQKKADKKDIPNKKTKHNPRHASILSKSPLVRVTFANLITTEAVSKKGSKKKTEAEKALEAAQQETSNTTEQKEKTEKSTKSKKDALTTKGLLGWIDSLTWKPVLDMGMFSDGNKFYPKVISLNFNLNVLHEHFLGWGNSGWMGGKFPFKL
jgi:hypothetical protein